MHSIYDRLKTCDFKNNFKFDHKIDSKFQVNFKFDHEIDFGTLFSCEIVKSIVAIFVLNSIII